MGRKEENISPSETQWALQSELLLGVSRTFALTIPQLPGELQRAVGNGYLLCRIADTIEDDPGLRCDAKFHYYELFLKVLNKRSDPEQLATRLYHDLSVSVSPEERHLIRELPAVVSLTHSLPATRQQALIRCARVMCNGMYEFQMHRSLDGLESVQDMYRYCYVVAGVVGEMLTDLFCDYSDSMRENKALMTNLSVCFGLGLQMTNILKDVWEDRNDGSCWLPRSVFWEHGDNLGEIIRAKQTDKLTVGIDELVGIAHDNLQAALHYSCLIPKSELGIRRFCLWAIGLALLTLQKIHRSPGYQDGQEVKISRRRVRAVIMSCNSVIYSNHLVRAWFDLASFGLPDGDPDWTCNPEELRILVESPHDQISQQRDAGVH